MRIGTRRSALALAQAELVAGLLGGEVVPMLTSGDRGGPAQDKSRWVAELEAALAAGEIDLAVHSAKDVPGELGDGLELLGSPPRAAVEDVLCGARSLAELPPGARVGTSSLRRAAQLRAARGELEPVPVRGNVDTRLRKRSDPAERLDALILARAGLQRLGLEREAGGALDPGRFVPAPGQGALALEGRAGDARAASAVAAISDEATFACLLAERALAHELGASCHTALGAHAQPAGGRSLRLRAWTGMPDGSRWIADELVGAFHDPRTLGRVLALRMRSVGAEELLRDAEEAQAVPAGGDPPA